MAVTAAVVEGLRNAVKLLEVEVSVAVAMQIVEMATFAVEEVTKLAAKAAVVDVEMVVSVVGEEINLEAKVIVVDAAMVASAVVEIVVEVIEAALVVH